MAEFFEQLNKAMRIRDISQSELCKLTGIPKSAMSQYMSGKFKPKQTRTFLLAEALRVNESWLMGYEDEPMEKDSTNNVYLYKNVIPLPKTREVPLIGTIACGEPILAQENIEEIVKMPEHINADFALRCKGDSMIDAHVYDGDIVYIHQQPMVENGEIAAVLVGDEATLKRVYINEDTVTLSPCNPAYPPFVYKGEEREQIKILGKAVAFLSTKI